MLAFNFKTFNCLLHNFRPHPWVAVNVRLWKSTCRLIITWTRAVSSSIQNNQTKSRLTCFSASVNECILVRRSILKIDPRKHGSQFSLVGDGVNYSSLTRLFSESVLTNKQFVLNMALSKQVSEFSTPSNEFEVESCTLTIRTKLPVFVDHVRPCHTLPTLIKRYKKRTLSWLSYCIKHKAV